MPIPVIASAMDGSPSMALFFVSAQTHHAMKENSFSNASSFVISIKRKRQVILIKITCLLLAEKEGFEPSKKAEKMLIFQRF